MIDVQMVLDGIRDRTKYMQDTNRQSAESIAFDNYYSDVTFLLDYIEKLHNAIKGSGTDD